MGWIVACVIGALLLLAIVALFSQIKLYMHFKRIGENDDFNIKVKALYGLVHFHYVIPMMKMNGLKGIWIERQKKLNLAREIDAGSGGSGKELIDKKKITQFFEDFKQLLAYTEDFNKWSKSTLRRVQCTEFRWSTRAGLKEAPETAILSGAIWALKSSVLHLVAKRVSLHTQPVLHVFPVYNTPHFSTEVIVAGQIRAWHALWAGLRLLRQIKKVKGGLSVWSRQMMKSNRHSPEPS